MAGTSSTFAVIETGGKQYRVEKGDVIEVERVRGDQHTFTPILLVNQGKVRATPKELEGTTVTAKVVAATKGPKIVGFTYKAKTNQRRRWGHRQGLTQLEITDIKLGSGSKAPAKKASGTADGSTEPIATDAAGDKE